MNLESIISVTGKPGLYKVLSQIKNGLIVESIVDGKRTPIHATDKVSALSDISIYTNDGDMPLAEIYEVIYKKTEGKAAVDHKAKGEELKSFMTSVVPNYDEDRVYNSDLKKLFQWFNMLVEKGLLVPSSKEEATKEAVTTETKPTKKTAPKKPVAKKAAPKTRAAKGGGATSMPSKKGA
jgi:DNA primase